MDLAALGPYAMTSGQIFSLPARPNSVNKYIGFSEEFRNITTEVKFAAKTIDEL